MGCSFKGGTAAWTGDEGGSCSVHKFHCSVLLPVECLTLWGAALEEAERVGTCRNDAPVQFMFSPPFPNWEYCFFYIETSLHSPFLHGASIFEKQCAAVLQQLFLSPPCSPATTAADWTACCPVLLLVFQSFTLAQHRPQAYHSAVCCTAVLTGRHCCWCEAAVLGGAAADRCRQATGACATITR